MTTASNLVSVLFTGASPSLGLHPSSPRLSPATIAEVLTLALANPKLDIVLSPMRRELLTGITLLWNDCFSEAHQIAQDHEGQADFDLLHAIFHRREGDYANSRYWFSSAGKHPCYLMLPESLQANSLGAWETRLTTQGVWSPAAFVSEISRLKNMDLSQRQDLEFIQALEIQSFAKWSITAK